ncbi:MAG: hypothetical protein EHM41_23400 [Chloroflexi bacterium]|nr:MAG: hypothetical protein EHM41_23400 [Chloroflexota bacterium]
MAENETPEPNTAPRSFLPEELEAAPTSKRGRPQTYQIDMNAVLDMMQNGGLRPPQIATELGIPVQTLRNRIKSIQEKQGILLQYRALQALQLTDLQAKILECITPDKIEAAPFKDLIAAFKILKDKEFTIEGKPSEIKGLVSYLIHMEKVEQAQKMGLPEPALPVDVTFTDEVRPDTSAPECADSLSDLDEQEF